MCDASTTHCSGTQLAPQGSQTLYCLFPPAVISPPLILSSLVLLQQSITTMPGERRSCHCRSETQCTYLRHMKVRTGLLMPRLIGADTTTLDIGFSVKFLYISKNQYCDNDI